MAAPPQARPAPSGWPSRVVRIASCVLPGGAVRDRYRQELLADLAMVDHRGRFALQVLLRAPRLRRAMSSTAPNSALEVIVAVRKPFLCRTGLHHKWEMATTDDGEEYIRCARCLKEKWTGLGDDRSVASNVIANYGSFH